ncbi:MAG: response regulator transcription factor [Solirubrobacteraceae bacterium]|nr:response regulator transcription factor [Solirubrobacteraceae bacterium]
MEQDPMVNLSGITVIVADRHPLVRRALGSLIDAEPGFAVLGHAPDADTIGRELRVHRPHVLLVEPEALGGDGLVVLPTVLAPSPRTRAVVLADEPSSALERHATHHGAAGLILKHAPPDELFSALRRAVEGLGGPWPLTAPA